MRIALNKKRLVFVVVLWICIFVLTILFDAGLGLLGFSSQLPSRYAYPPGFKQTLRSICEFECQYELNSRGIRYPDIPLNKDSREELRFFMLGDSFTEGYGVEANETFGAVMERSCFESGTAVLFINGGIRGTGPLEYMGTLFSVGFQYEIDGVLICLYVNDVEDCPESSSFEPKWVQLTQPDGFKAVLAKLYPCLFAMAMNLQFYYSSNYVQRGESRDIVEETTRKAKEMGISEEAIEKWRASLPADLLDAANRFEFNGAALSQGLLNPHRFSECLNLTMHSSENRFRNMLLILNKMVQECRNRSISVYVILIPLPYMYDPESFNENDPRIKTGTIVSQSWLTETMPLQSRLQAWAEEKVVPFFDLTATFRDAAKECQSPLNYRLDIHWTPLGHRVAGKAIQQWLVENQAIPVKLSP